VEDSASGRGNLMSAMLTAVNFTSCNAIVLGILSAIRTTYRFGIKSVSKIIEARPVIGKAFLKSFYGEFLHLGLAHV